MNFKTKTKLQFRSPTFIDISIKFSTGSITMTSIEMFSSDQSCIFASNYFACVTATLPERKHYGIILLGRAAVTQRNSAFWPQISLAKFRTACD